MAESDFGSTDSDLSPFFTHFRFTATSTSMLDLLTGGTCAATPAPAPVLGRYLTCVGL